MATQLPTRQLGRNGPQIPGLGFGLMGLSAWYGPIEPTSTRLSLLTHAHSLGATFWDTADVYADSEDLVGQWFAGPGKGKRDDIFLATKFGCRHIGDGEGPMIDSSPEYVRGACEKSLKRMGVECIDLYYCHRVDLETPIEKTVRAMVELKNEGKIKYLGLSEVSSKTLRRAYKIHPIHAVQVEYSPFSLDIEHPDIDLLKTCRELGVATVAYSPLGRGMLTGAYKSPDDFADDDFRRFSPRFQPDTFKQNLKLVDDLRAFAQKKGCTTGQLTLAWLLAQGDDIFPIPGTKKVKYLEENLGALDVKLEEAEVGDIRGLIEKAEVHGARYPEAMKSHSFADTPEEAYLN